MQRRFKDKVAVVTGGANGLGENLVRRLVAEGAKVVVADYEKEPLEALCASLPDSTLGVLTDVRDRAQVEAMVAEAVEKYGKIDLLFNNAGIMRFMPFLEISDKDWHDVINTNLNGYFYTGQAVAREMVRLGIRGVIVNTSSTCSVRVTRNSAAYGPSKGGVALLTKIMSLDLAPYGIRVTAVAPGSAMTRITEKTRNDKEKYKMFLGKYSAGRFATPEEVTSVMLFVASDDASYVHGENYLVDSTFTTR